MMSVCVCRLSEERCFREIMRHGRVPDRFPTESVLRCFFKLSFLGLSLALCAARSQCGGLSVLPTIRLKRNFLWRSVIISLLNVVQHLL